MHLETCAMSHCAVCRNPTARRRRCVEAAGLILLIGTWLAIVGDIAEAWGALLTVEAPARGCRIVMRVPPRSIFGGTLSQQNVASQVGEASFSKPQLFIPRTDRLRARHAPR